MRRFLKSLLILTLTLTTLTSSTEACCFCPLLNPFQWGCGHHHHDPYATRRVIDDWLGYGYLRGNQNGSLGHYPYQPGSCFCPLLLPFHIFSHCLFPSPCGQAWGSPYANGYCGVQPLVPPMPAPMPAPMMPYNPTPFGNECCPTPCVPQPMQCAPTPVQVPITTWRPVTVDRGSYQMVWVPRPVTEMVPQTSWQTQYQMPYQPQMQMPATDCAPSGSGIYEPMMPMPSGTIPMNNAPLQIPMQTGCGGSAPCQSQGTAWNGGTPGWNSANSWQPGMNTAWTPVPRPQMAAVPNAAWQQFPNAMPQQMAMPQQQMAWRPNYPVPSNPYYGVPAQQYQANSYANRMPYPAYAQSYPRPQYPAYQSYPSYTAGNSNAPGPAYPSGMMMPPMQAAYPPAGMGDLMGDHEMATIPGTAPMTGMAPANGAAPVMQNSFRGGIPVYQTSYAAPMRPQSVNKYRNVIR